MGWCRITLSPADWARLEAKDPKAAADYRAMNAEADRLDPLSETSKREAEQDVEADFRAQDYKDGSFNP